MMNDMMSDGLMWGMGIGGFVVLTIIVLAVAALVKFVFFAEGNVAACPLWLDGVGSIGEASSQPARQIL